MTLETMKQLVEQYCLGQLSPEYQQRVEKALDSDPQVRAYFDTLADERDGVSDDSPSEVREMLLQQLAAYRGPLANEHDRALFEQARRASEAAAAPTSVAGVAVNSSQESPAHLIAQWSELISACLADRLSAVEQGCARMCKVLDDVARHTPGSLRCTLDCTQVLSGADENSRTFPLGLSEGEECGLVNQEISICIKEDRVPHGLVWLAVEDAEQHTVIMYLPRLELADGDWVGNIDIRDLLDRRIQIATTTVRIIPATEENRQAFDSDRVREFIREELDLKQFENQRTRARSFLGMKGTS